MRSRQSGPASIWLRRRGVLPPERAMEQQPWAPQARSACAATQLATASATSAAVSLTTRSPVRLSSALVAATSGNVPGASLARHERVRFVRPPGTCGVVRAVDPVGRMCAPSIEDRRAESPRLLDLVLACEESRVAEHAVEERELIRAGRLLGERPA